MSWICKSRLAGGRGPPQQLSVYVLAHSSAQFLLTPTFSVEDMFAVRESYIKHRQCKTVSPTCSQGESSVNSLPSFI